MRVWRPLAQLLVPEALHATHAVILIHGWGHLSMDLFTYSSTLSPVVMDEKSTSWGGRGRAVSMDGDGHP